MTVSLNTSFWKHDPVGVFDGIRMIHLAPPANRVPELMGDLFDYLKKDQDIILIKNCVFHYETEFVHPFMDGNCQPRSPERSGSQAL